jgi:transposase
MSINGAPVIAASVVAVDVGKNKAVLSVTGADRHRLFGPADFAMTAPAVVAVLERVGAVLPPAPVKVGVEAAGHYHRPPLGSAVWPAGWEVVELSPARVAEQRRVQGRRRVKTDIDLEAITELVLAGHGVPVTARSGAVVELTGWAMQRGRRVQTRTATKNQPLAQSDRCFPGVDISAAGCVGHQGGPSGRGGVRRSAPVGRARGEPICQVRRQSWAAGAAVGGGAAGGGGPRRLAILGGAGGPPGVSR